MCLLLGCFCLLAFSTQHLKRMWGWNRFFSFSFHMNMAVNGEQNWTIRKYSLQTDLYLVEKELLPSSNDHLNNQVQLKTHGLHNGFFFASNNKWTMEIIKPMDQISFSKTSWLLSFSPNWLIESSKVYYFLKCQMMKCFMILLDHMLPK